MRKRKKSWNNIEYIQCVSLGFPQFHYNIPKYKLQLCLCSFYFRITKRETGRIKRNTLYIISSSWNIYIWRLLVRRTIFVAKTASHFFVALFLLLQLLAEKKRNCCNGCKKRKKDILAVCKRERERETSEIEPQSACKLHRARKKENLQIRCQIRLLYL